MHDRQSMGVGVGRGRSLLPALARSTCITTLPHSASVLLPACVRCRNHAVPLRTTLRATRLAMQAEALRVPTVPFGIRGYRDLVNAGVTVDWRGRLSAPPGAVDDDGFLLHADSQTGEAAPASAPSPV